MSQKRIAAIHDISGLGKCSLTVALPLCSAAGIETSVIPTAVLSTHTGGFTDYTFRDLTDDILPVAEHWSKLNFQFDAVYTGYLGSARQIDIVGKAIELIKGNNTLVISDPAMADNGSLYKGFETDFPRNMLNLCKKADIIVPNITEAVLMLGESFKEGPYTKEYIEDLIERLHNKTSSAVVLTGVYFDDKKLGAACFDGKQVNYVMQDKLPSFYHGTGDVFASVLTSALVGGRNLLPATEIAVKFTWDCIKYTMENENYSYGVNFESQVPNLIKYLGL